MRKHIIIALSGMLFILIGALIGYYLSIGILYPIEIDTPNATIAEEKYTGNLEAIEDDGYVNPVIYSITKSRLEQFINNHSTDVFNGINPSAGLGEFVATFKKENGIIYELEMSTSPPTVSKSSRFNIGQFIIDGLFIKFYSNNNMEKVLKKNGINDKIIKCSLMQIVGGSENTDTLVAWLDCNSNDYFLVWDKCWNSVERFKKMSMMHYFQASSFNYFTFFDDESFCREFTDKNADYLFNNTVIDNRNSKIYHSYGKVPLRKTFEIAGYMCNMIDDNTMEAVGTKNTLIVKFEKTISWYHTYSISIYDKNNDDYKINDFMTCELVDGEFIIKDEACNKLSNILKGRIRTDYNNLNIEFYR